MTDATAELPEELKNLIQESVKQEIKPEEVVSNAGISSKAVKGSQLLQFFAEAKTIVKESDLEVLRKSIEASYDGSDPKERIIYIRKEIEKIYDSTWQSLGVSVELGQRAVSGVQMVLGDNEVDEKFRQTLKESVLEFKAAESEIVGRLLFGDKAFEERKKQQTQVQLRKKALEVEFASLTSEEKGERVQALKKKAFSLRQKLMSMGGSGAAQYLKGLKDEEATVMLDLSALALMIQDGSSILPKGLGPPPGLAGKIPQQTGCKKCSHHRH